jgi:hypothetical protein
LVQDFPFEIADAPASGNASSPEGAADAGAQAADSPQSQGDASSDSGDVDGGSASSEHPSSDAPPVDATRDVLVENLVTNGPSEMREDSPAYLSTETRPYCAQGNCRIAGTAYSSGDVLIVTCQTRGERITNGEDGDSVDDINPRLYESTLWYGVALADGGIGYISEVRIEPGGRGGLSLEAC